MTNEVLPLLLESADRAAVVRFILRACRPEDVVFLASNPTHLGVRCEAHLAGVAPEWFADNGFLSDEDRDRLGVLTSDALLVT
jgi:hypothetical protein